MSDNPFQAPETVVESNEGGGADPRLDGAVTMLRQTKPWVRFISVMMFIGSAFMIFAGLLMMMGAAVGAPPGFGVVLGIVYIAMALLYIVPAIFLWQYADRIALLMHERSAGALASALQAQKSFWKFVGIAILVIMGLYAVGIVFAIVAAVIGTMG